MNKKSNTPTERIIKPDANDEEALREYGRQLAMDSLMEQFLLEENTHDHSNNIVSLGRHRWSAKHWVPAAAAALVVGALSFWKLGTTPNTMAKLEPKWILQAANDADYSIIDANRVMLRKGELRFTSTQPASLTVDTPCGTSTAQGTDFLIGHHQAESEPFSQSDNNRNNKPSNQNNTMNNKTNYTRMLVLAGTVLLATDKGSYAAGPNEAVIAKAGDAPQKILVDANSQFAMDLYAQLAKENPGQNLFFSPYSVSNALLMTAEGARGETAREMGAVLGFPDSLMRQGNDQQQIPWEMGKIRVGQSELNRLMNNEGSVTPEQAKIRAQEASLVAKIEEMRKKMEELDKDRRNDLFIKINNLTAELARVRSQIETSKLRVANAIWGEQTLPFNSEWKSTVTSAYGVDAVQAADFLANAENERLRINDWAEKQTEGLIKDLFSAGSFDSTTRLTLVNAIYFRGDWKQPFEPSRTKPGQFTLESGNTINVPLMYQSDDSTVRYAAFQGDGRLIETSTEQQEEGDGASSQPDKNGFAVLERPYRGDKLSMVIIAPNDPAGLPAIEAGLSAERLNTWINSLKQREVNVYLPKFTMETSYDALQSTLATMGMPSAFSEATADFSGMTSKEKLSIGSVVHNAVISVNEVGTEAAAATGVGMLKEGFRSNPTFRADRPFLYLIRDRESGTVLFLGRMLTPTAE